MVPFSQLKQGDEFYFPNRREHKFIFLKFLKKKGKVKSIKAVPIGKLNALYFSINHEVIKYR